MATSVFRVDNQTVKHERDLSTCESCGFETAGLDQGESTGMSIQEFTDVYSICAFKSEIFQCQCISCPLLCGAFAFAPPTCHPSAIALAPLPCDIKNFRSVRSHCQTHSGKTGLELCPAVKNACCSGLEHRCLSLAICVATSLHVEIVSATSLAC